MKLTNVKTLVFSSSATVYGDPQYLPIDENHPTGATNAYVRSKLHIEKILRDVANSDAEWKIICLRYFNPVGAHESGLISEDPQGVPNNLMPYIAQVPSGMLPHLHVHGNDYPTADGTGARDYIHVVDLAEKHLAALSHLERNTEFDIFNLGMGKGYSGLEVVSAFEDACQVTIKYSITKHRIGDIASCYGRVDKAERLLGWKALKTINEVCITAWQHKV